MNAAFISGAEASAKALGIHPALVAYGAAQFADLDSPRGSLAVSQTQSAAEGIIAGLAFAQALARDTGASR